MPKSIRIRTEPGVDRNINIKIDQDFDSLEILSLKLRQEDLYTQFCADYGVVVGRVIANGGFGIPNAHISIFIPIDEIDENDPVISTLYPYKSPEGKNEDGYRYNLLPYENEYYGHSATGTFPTVEDVLTRKEVLQVYEKYYRYSVRTNESGDFMITGVPLGMQKIVMDLDLSNMGEFSLRPSDLIRMGKAVPSQFNGQLFKSSENIDSLPQILHEIKDIDVSSFWGQDEACDVGITRVDFDLRERDIEILPHSTFMGSIFSSNEEDYIKGSCRPKKDTGNLCDTVAGPGTILAIRQTIGVDDNGDPVLEQYNLEDGGNVIDDNGAWLIDLPMNLDYITTNEFGERVVSYDPTVGIPTKAKYRFKIKWQNEAGLQSKIMRANYLIPNVKEHWNISPTTSGTLTGLTASGSTYHLNKSYAFSLDWNDYADKSAAINCEDSFYLFTYNKVYTTAAHIDRFKWGYNRASHYGIKEITDRACMSENNRFPTNEGQRNFDFLYFVFNLLLNIVTPILIVILPIVHVLALIYPIIRFIVNIIIWLINSLIWGICLVINAIPFVSMNCERTTIQPLPNDNPFKNITLPMLTYPDCEACPCESEGIPEGESATGDSLDEQSQQQVANASPLANFTNYTSYEEPNCVDSGNNSCGDKCFGTDDEENAVVKSFLRVLFSGYDGAAPSDNGNWGGNSQQDYPKPEWYKSPFSLEAKGDDQLRFAYDVSLPQAINLMSQRGRYFDSTFTNRIRTQIINGQFTNTPMQSPSNTWNQFEDLPLIFVTDSSVNLNNAQLVTFVNNSLIEDPNVNGITGFTDTNGNPYNNNQFGNQGITGTVTSNASTYVTKQVTYVKPNNQTQTVNLQLYSPNTSGSSYNFKSGNEYFQVIGSMTVQEARNLQNNYGNYSSSIMSRYFLNKVCRFECDQAWNNPNGGPRFSFKPLTHANDDENYKIYFLTRGVDPYSPKQKIRYDIGKLFGQSYGNSAFQFEGDYFLNIPIQKIVNGGDKSIPARHHVVVGTSVSNNNNSTTNNPNNALFHGSYLFTPDNSLYTSFNTKAFAYYSSLDLQLNSAVSNYGSNGETVFPKIRQYQGADFKSISITGNLSGDNTPQDKIAGASYQWGAKEGGEHLKGNSNGAAGKLYTISPSYWLYNAIPPQTTMSNSNKLVFRSDRLPTSSNRETGLADSSVLHLQDFPLQLNNNFSFYLISENGETTSVIGGAGMGQTSNDGTGGLNDLSGDTTSPISGVLETFTCDGMVPFNCYSGSGTNFGVDTPCDDPDRIVGGCYTFVKPLYILTLLKDYDYLFEWRTRMKFMFGVCRGIISQVFQNNWVNGTLYMPSFQKKTFYDSNNEVRRYKYCGDPNQSNAGLWFSDRVYRGPIYFNTETNSFFYRSAPYYNGQFISQTTDTSLFQRYPGNNDGQIWQPTTIIDLGPKTDYLKEIMFTPEFEGYIIDSIQSTSYQDISGILNLFVISRLVNSSMLQQIFGAGDASIQQLFSRQDATIANRFFDSRVDGDYAQMVSINSEYGILPYIDGNYTDEITIGDDRIGIWFTGETENRELLGFGKLPYSNFDYIGAQEVPFYSWEVNGTTLFGDQENRWVTGPNTILSAKYQEQSFNGVTDYPYPDVGGGTGYLYNRNALNPNLDEMANTNTSHPGRFRVGSPFYFYFGLKRGKSAMNRFINKYIFYND